MGVAAVFAIDSPQQRALTMLSTQDSFLGVLGL